MAKELGFTIEPHQTSSEIIRAILSDSAIKKMQEILYYDKNIAFSSPLMAGAKSGLERFKRDNLPFFLISRRRDSELAKQLLVLRGLWPDYFNESNSYFVLEPEDKDKKAKELGITHYLDDEVKVLAKLVSVERRFLFDRFGVFGKSDFYTAISSWPDFLKELKK